MTIIPALNSSDENKGLFSREWNEGTFQIVLEGKVVGELDICQTLPLKSVNIQLVDHFLTIEQMSQFLKKLKDEFGLPEHQKVSIHQM